MSDEVKAPPKPDLLQVLVGLQEVVRRLTARVAALEARSEAPPAGQSIFADAPKPAAETHEPKPLDDVVGFDPWLAEALQRISERHGLNPSRIRGASTSKRLVAARRELIHAAEREGLTLAEIGAFLGRHPATIREILKARSP